MVGALVSSKHKRFAEAVGGTGEDVYVAGVGLGVSEDLFDASLFAFLISDAHVVELIPVAPEVIVIGTRRYLQPAREVNKMGQGCLRVASLQLVHLGTTVAVIGAGGKVLLTQPDVALIGVFVREAELQLESLTDLCIFVAMDAELPDDIIAVEACTFVGLILLKSL